jgi:hypothetical protein
MMANVLPLACMEMHCRQTRQKVHAAFHSFRLRVDFGERK